MSETSSSLLLNMSFILDCLARLLSSQVLVKPPPLQEQDVPGDGDVVLKRESNIQIAKSAVIDAFSSPMLNLSLW